MEGGVSIIIDRIDIDAVLVEDLDYFQVAFDCGDVERGSMKLGEHVDFCTILQEKLGDIFMAFIAGIVDGSPIV